MKFYGPRLAAWSIPLACFTLSATLIAGRHVAFVHALAAGKKIDVELFQARVDTDAVTREIAAARYACAPRKAREESKFFADLRSCASLAGVSIVRWRSDQSTFGENKIQSGPPPADQNGKEQALKGVTEARCTLTLDGSFPSLRNFLRALWKSNRLYTVTDVTWKRADLGNELTLTLCRYIAPASTSGAAGLTL